MSTRKTPAKKPAKKPAPAKRKAAPRKAAPAKKAPATATRPTASSKPPRSTKVRKTREERLAEFEERHGDWMAQRYRKAVEMESKRIGRPTDYDPEYCVTAIALGYLGKNITEIAFEIGVTRQTLYNWGDQHPEFFDALQRAREAAECFYMEHGRAGMMLGKEFNGQVWEFMAKNHLPESFADRSQTDITSGGAPIKFIMTPEDAAL